MNDIYSFYQLISKYRIEIPIIQRDYAQGRDNVKATDVRKSLVGKMINAVENENETLFFDFVYGRVDENKFIPFDGQQRLTTLFLFHKYVFEKCQSVSDCRHKGNCICKDILGRFSYATRQSSREFCEELVKHDVIPDNAYRKLLEENYKSRLKEDDKEKEEKTKNYIDSIDNWIYRFITNQPWFYPDWQKDPTVMGMLTMLDEIHNQIKGKDRFKNFAEKLTSGCNCPITFHFVDMGEHKLSDETYVKMNARGKQLTPFENFKASLEQYIEEKKKENEGKQKTYDVLLNRLKGQYDPITNKYTGIDGTWLELFWEVANINRTEKELPDTLMMSFFNRHFMNVWRCWYAGVFKNEKEVSKIEKVEDREAEHKKQGNYKILNERITNDKEFPLFPTKDQFIPFEIYQCVLERCGIDSCLTPLFNICDALCKKDNNIETYCQAVWNREPEAEKWILYNGVKDKNTNRETYPSRVAFYALMKFFATNTDTTSLNQWMRFVWNVIENSTIDSSETYHAALRLIEKLSSKSHNIYNALANEFESFELGNQYHAKEQVEEEIIKAGKIQKDFLWTQSIEDAEKCPYLKGKIWVLFQDKENTTLDKFNQRLGLLKDILNDTDDYYLSKILISYYGEKKPNKAINLKKENWKNLLTNQKEGLFGCFQKIESNTINPYIEYQWIIDIATTQLLNNSRDDAKIVGNYGNSIVLWGTTGCKRFVFSNEVWGNVVIGNYRTLLVDTSMELQHAKRVVKNTSFVSYFDVNFKYNNLFFQWYGVPNETELDVYLMEDKWEGYKRQPDFDESKPDKDNYYCFKVTKEMETDSSLFTKQLDCLIAQAYPEKSNKVCYYDCPNKVCE